MKQNIPIVVFSHVDSVLSVRNGRSGAAAAADTLRQLANEDVPVVLCSGMTRAELEYTSQEFGIDHPFICEHGAALFVPAGYFGFDVPDAHEVSGYSCIEFGRSYGEVVDVLRSTARRLGVAVCGFNDMSVEDVARESGATLLQARLAKLREYGELFRVSDPSSVTRNRLFKGLHAAHLRTLAGRVYDHVGGAIDCSLGVHLLCTLYRRALGPIVTVGLAGAPWETHLVEALDYPVIVHGDEAGPGLVAPENASIARVDDLAGWTETIVRIVGRLRGGNAQSRLATVG